VAAGVLIALFVGAAVLVKLRERRARHHPEAVAETVTPEAAAQTVAGAGDPAGSPAERKR